MAVNEQLDLDLCTEISDLPPGLHRLAMIIWHHGAKKPAAASDLGAILGMDRRAIAAAVRELVMVYQQPIGSKREQPAGYYWIQHRTLASVSRPLGLP